MLSQKCFVCCLRRAVTTQHQQQRFYLHKTQPLRPVTPERIRNIGVIAHIDAGKTTTTERLLYLAGTTNTIGDVDSGNTVTDYMELERERGITIQSAAVTSMYKHHRITLIDTPGHVDFTLEVDRCLRVLDGAVTVVDASSGVQAQTLTVWRQATKHSLPSIFFVNKMDKPAANYHRSLQSITSRLGCQVVPIVVPLLDGKGQMKGIINILDRTQLTSDVNGTEKFVAVEPNTPEWEVLAAGWEELLSRIAETDQDFQSQLMSAPSAWDIPMEGVRKALRRLTLERRLSPVACGSALRQTESVRSVLDMVLDFLPSPLERQYALPAGVDMCALVFKIGDDARRGKLSYTRVYKGTLKQNTSVLNATQNSPESSFKLHTPFSDLLQPADEVEAGEICVLSGLQHTKTGDTLIDRHAGGGGKHRTDLEVRMLSLEGISPPDPVFSCSIEPPSAGTQIRFLKALEELSIEDPSLRFREEAETGQMVVEGMGELHIEVTKERLKREYDLNVFMGPLRVGYREIPNAEIEHTAFVEDTFGGGERQWCKLTLRVEPTPSGQQHTNTKFHGVAIDLDTSVEGSGGEETPPLRPEWIRTINDGCRNSLFNGPTLGFPVCNLHIALRQVSTSSRRPNVALLNASASKCVSEALKLVGTTLVEPVMLCEVTLIADDLGQQVHTDEVLNELSRRRATLLGMDAESEGHLMLVRARIPLSETTGLANRLRSITSGLCSLHLEFMDYELVSADHQAQIVERQLNEGP